MARLGLSLLILALTLCALGVVPARSGGPVAENPEGGGTNPPPDGGNGVVSPEGGGDFTTDMAGDTGYRENPSYIPPEPPVPPGSVQPIERLPDPINRDRSSGYAQRIEDQLNRSPYPDPSLSGRAAREHLRGGDPDGAARVLDRLIGAGGADAEAYRLRAAARFQKEDWAGAYTDARTALDSNPNDTIAADLMGTSRMQLQRLGLKPPEVKPGGERTRAPEQAEERAAGERSSWNVNGAVPLLGGEAPGGDPRRAFLAAIDRKIHIGGTRDAFMDLTRHLDRYPKDASALAKRAYLLNRWKNPQAALVDADRALMLAPEDPAALREKAYALIQLGRVQDAMGMLERAILLQPNYALGYLYRAMALQAMGRTEEALKDYARAAALDPALKGYYDTALAGAGGGAKPAGGASSRWRFRAIIAFVALPLVLLGLWGAARQRSGQTTQGAAGEPAATPGPAETLLAGGLLGGTYRIGRVLGRGGMGVVFEAWDLGLERNVAIKQLRTPEGAREDYERFLREARLVAQLAHPNIVQIHTLVEDNSLLYLVFELVDGKGLDAVLAEKGRLSLDEVRGAVRDVCAALDCAHEARIIHRDLKPSNIMRSAKGGYKVMDFGIAHQSQSEALLTQTGAWGTPPYMAPEQERGLVSKESDLYALGCTVYELLTGGRPFGPGADKMTPRFAPASSLVNGLPPMFDAFMDRALAPDPARRFHSGREFLVAYEACLSGRIAA